MAKMFYTLDEVCEKLGLAEDAVREMATSGQIQEFRDRDKLMFKVEQIDLLAGDEDVGEVHLELEDTSGASGISLSDTGGGSALGLDTGTAMGGSLGTGIPLMDSREGTGISVFDTEHGGEGSGAGFELPDVDSTRVDDFEDDLDLEAVGSGSGLLDLTRESDDTSLGAELLEEVYSGDDQVEIPANASGLFEAAAGDMAVEEATAAAGIAAMPVIVEAYDGGGSGLSIGLMIGAMAAMICVSLVVIVGIFGATPAMATTISSNLWLWVGGLAGGTLLLGLIGLFIGKASE